MSETFHYGGQAVIEGVMIRGQKNLSMAVRRPNGEIAVMTKPISEAQIGWKRRIPFVRGIVILAEAMILGIQALFKSANIAMEDEDGEEGKEELSKTMLFFTLLGSFGFAIALFFFAPLFLSRLFDSYVDSNILKNLIEGCIRIGLFFLYLAVINLMPDIRRVFAYHGAEHKAVNAHEDGAPMKVEAIRKYSTAHARCGTSFLLTFLVISIIVFCLLPHMTWWLLYLSRIILIPVIIAVGYEVNRFGAMHSNNFITRSLVFPGLALQSFTTRQPDGSQLEVAINALEAAVKADGLGEVVNDVAGENVPQEAPVGNTEI